MTTEFTISPTEPIFSLQHLLLWAPAPPIIANTFFEPRFNSEPLILQYAHRVLEQHPVALTFFFVPQVVQALRYDDLGIHVLNDDQHNKLTMSRLCCSLHL